MDSPNRLVVHRMAKEYKSYMQDAIQLVIERWWIKKLLARATDQEKQHVEKNLTHECECINCEDQIRSRLRIAHYLTARNKLDLDTFETVWEKNMKPVALAQLAQSSRVLANAKNKQKQKKSQ
jgi:hypothetical protein